MSLSRSRENTLVKPSHGLQQYATRTPFGHTALQIAQLEPPLTERSDSRKALTTSRKRHHCWRSTADPVSSGDTVTRALVPEWNEEARTLDSVEKKSSCTYGHQERESSSLRTAGTGADGSRETAGQSDSERDHHCAAHKRGAVPISSCQHFELPWGTNPRNSSALQTVDGPQESAPKMRRACESGNLVSEALPNEQEKHFTKLM